MTAPNFSGPPSKRGERLRLARDLAAAVAVLGLLFWLAFLLCGPRKLEAGLAVTREIGDGEVHLYRARLAAGEWLNVTVDQSAGKVDALLRLLGPDGKEIAHADSLDGPRGLEELAAVAERPGLYTLRVSRSGGDAGRVLPAAYRLSVKSLGQPADPQARRRAEALHLSQSAADLCAEPESENAQITRRRKALRLWHDLGDRQKEAGELYQIGAAHIGLGRLEEAVTFFQRSEAIWAELGNREEQAWVFYELGKIEKKRGRSEEARKAFDRGLALAQEPATTMVLLQVRGAFHTDQGDPDRALPDLQESLRLTRDVGDSREEANVLHELGFAYRRLERWDDAILHFRMALEKARAIDNLEIKMSAHNSLGGIYKNLGDWDQAIQHYQLALSSARELRRPGAEATILNNLALVHHRSLRIQRALDLFQAALALKQLDPATEATALNNMAFVQLELEHPREALKLCGQALRLAAGGNQETEAAILEAQAIAHLKLGEHARARETLARALALNERRKDRFRQASLTVVQGKLARAEGDLDTALRHAREAVALVESFRTGVEDETLRASFLASKRDPYDFYVDTLVALDQARPGEGFDADSLQINEMSRARSLLDLLNQAATQASRRTDPALPDRLRQLRLEMNRLRAELRRLRDAADDHDGGDTAPAPTPADLAEASRKLEAAEAAYERTQAEIRRQNLGATVEAQYRPLNLAEIQSQVLGEGTLLLEYALGEKQSYLWAVTPTSLHVFPLPSKREIEKTARSFYDQLLARTVREVDEADVERADVQAAQLAAELSRIILKPVESAGLLQQESKILVVSDGALQYIPFSALPLPSSLGDRPARPVLMVEEHEIVHLPSASVLASLRQELDHRQPPALTLALIADPVFERDDRRFQETGAGDLRPTGFLGRLLPPGRPARRQGRDDQAYTRLHWSEAEANAILKLVDSSQAFEARDFRASVATVTGARLDQYQLLHFATHGRIDSSRPERSSLVLSLYNRDGEPQDGYLRLTDVYNLRLNADLVVLSACETALGKEMRGEGLIGLTRGFMYAGSRRVLASLWSVDDRVTAELMERLYKGILKERKSPAAALRQAQRDMLRDEDWKSPYYWAGFSLQGEWR